MLITVAVLSVGSAAALEVHNNPPVLVDGGNLNIQNGGMIFQRSDSVQTHLTMKNTNAQTAIVFEDTDSNQQYILRQTVDGKRFDFLNFKNGVPRVDLDIQTASGNVGIGNLNPTEKLDVNGNIKLSGNILSNGDICIGTCP